MIHEYQGTVLQGSVYGAAGPLRSDILFDLPLSITANASLMRRLAAATGLLMMFYPADPHPENYLRLAADGTLEINYGQPAAGGPPSGEAEKELIRALSQNWLLYVRGALSVSADGVQHPLCRDAPNAGIAGPLSALSGRAPSRDPRVYVADGACFPRLPAKNLTFTIMANAMRIASRIRDRLP